MTERAHEFFLATDSDLGVLASIAYRAVSTTSGDAVVGAYYGYVGGSEYDGGFFVMRSAQLSLLDYEQVDALEADDPELFGALEEAMRAAWVFIEQDDTACIPSQAALGALFGARILVSEHLDPGLVLRLISTTPLTFLRVHG